MADCISVLIIPDPTSSSLDNTLASIANQTHAAWECIVLNLNENDSCSRICQEWSKRFPRGFKELRLSSVSPAEALNTGIQSSSGNYILPLHPSLSLEPTALQRMSMALDSDSSIAYVHASTRISANQSVQAFPEQGIAGLLTLPEGIYPGMFRRHLWERLEGYKVCFALGGHEWEFWLNALKSEFKGRVLQEPLAICNLNLAPVPENQKTYAMSQMAMIHPEVFSAPDRERMESVVLSRQPEVIEKLQKQLITTPQDRLTKHFLEKQKGESLRNQRKELALSVIMPTFGRPDMLIRCLEGFAKQTLPKELFEVVIADDGSYPSQHQAVQQFTDRLQVKYIWNPHGGPASSRNTAVLESRAPYLVLHDDDDIPAPDYMERCLDFHERFPGEGYILLAKWIPDATLGSYPLLNWMVSGAEGLCGFPEPYQFYNFWNFFGGTISCKRSLFRFGMADPGYWTNFEDVECGFRLNLYQTLHIYFDPRVCSFLSRAPEFYGLFLRCYREGRSQHRLYMQYSEAARNGIRPALFQSEKLIEALEPYIDNTIETIGRLEGLGNNIGDNETFIIGSDTFRGLSALHAAYSVAVQYGRGLGWIDSVKGSLPHDRLAQLRRKLDLHYHRQSSRSPEQLSAELDARKREAGARDLASKQAMPPKEQAPIEKIWQPHSVATSAVSQRKALVFFPHNPYPPKSGAHHQCLALLRCLRRLNYDVTFLSTELFTDSPWSASALQSFSAELGIRVEVVSKTSEDQAFYDRAASAVKPPKTPWPGFVFPGLAQHFTRLVQSLRPELVYLNYAMWAPLADVARKAGSTVLLQTHDLVSANGAKRTFLDQAFAKAVQDPAALIPFTQENFFDGITTTVDREELERCAMADSVIAVSPDEVALLSKLLPGKHVVYMPSTSSPIACNNTYSDRPVMVMSSNAFNIQGYLYFACRVIPILLPLCPDFFIDVIGSGAKGLPKVDIMNLLGFVDDITSAYARARFAISPIVGGTGMQVKIVDAMAHGLPVVALTKAARNSPIVHGENGFLAENAGQFAEYCAKLWKDQSLCRSMGEAARAAITKFFSEEFYSQTLANTIKVASAARES